MTAREALTLAVETLRCNDECDLSDAAPDCMLVYANSCQPDPDAGWWIETRGTGHVVAASALMDGFSVEEVTEAGG